MGEVKADRFAAMALIKEFLKKNFLLSSKVIISPIGRSILERLNNGTLTRDDLRSVEKVMGESAPQFLQRHFGGSTWAWANILYNGKTPTRIDLQCLKISLVTEDLYRIHYKSKEIRAMQKVANHGGARQIEGCRRPIIRRDGSIYNADSRNLLRYRNGYLKINGTRCVL